MTKVPRCAATQNANAGIGGTGSVRSATAVVLTETKNQELSRSPLYSSVQDALILKNVSALPSATV